MHHRNIFGIITLYLIFAFSINSIIAAQEIEPTAEITVEAPAEAPTEIPTEALTEIPTEIPTEAPTATEAPTLEATVEVTSEATTEITPEATAEATTEITVTAEVTASPTPESTLTQIIESENAAVIQAGMWTQYLNESASGGSFIASSGSTDDILTLTFSGSSLEIIVVQSAILGTFAIEIDGAIVQTVNANSPDMVVGTRVAVNGLSEGTHIVRIIPVEGIVAVDAFALEATATIIVPEATEVAETTETPMPEVSDLGSEQAAMTFVVTNTVDSGAGSLRQAILNANANAGIDTITFNIPGSGVQTIQVSTGLPTITSAVIVNGYSQPGSAAASGSTAATLLIELDGQFAGSTSFGLLISGSGSTIKGLIINRFSFEGIFLSGVNAKNNRIEGNHIGVDAAGTTGLGNNASGIALGNGASNNIIGGITPAARNVISGNDGAGIVIYNNSKTNRIQGNYIGTNADGTAIIANTSNGVQIGLTSIGNIVGGTIAGARNIISGNENGVGLSDLTSGNLIQGNYIGTDVTGTVDLRNNFAGVAIDHATGNTVGGTTAGAGNVISGNNTSGIGIYNGSKRNLIQGNIIGLNAAGNADLGNFGDGISVADPGTSANTIGGTTASARNIISGNDASGIGLYNSATANTVQKNYIGTDTTGSQSLGNGFNGIGFDGSFKNTISQNVISGNGFSGIAVYSTGGDSSQNRVLGNIIGLNATGTAARPNQENGISIENISNMVIGGTTAAARNIISGNGYSGIFICHCAGGITIQGNYIGTDITGNLAIGNGFVFGASGIDIFGSPNNTIGGTTAGARNVISGNGDGSLFTGGIFITGEDSQGNKILGNYIGTNAKGNADLGNLGAGVTIDDNASNNIIGGTTAGARNVISGNGDEGNSIYGPGVHIRASDSINNRVQGNFIGINAAGTTAMPNSDGVLISQGANHNTIGGTTASARNIISGNVYSGIIINDPDSSDNLIQGNFIGTNPAGNRALGNGVNGVFISESASHNTIGGTTASARNIISGNVVGSGVAIEGYVDDPGTETRANANTIQGNYIGLDVTGNIDLGNGRDGVSLDNQTFGNLIGGTVPGARNVISGDAFNSVAIFASNNTVQGNTIGLNAAGTKIIDGGIYIEDGANNVIGGTASGSRNIISGNSGTGIEITGAGSTGNTVQGNYIGTNPSGNSRLGNTNDGIWIHNGASNNTIGGTIPSARNIISGNGGNGVALFDTDTKNNLVQGNYIGTNVAGSVDLGNTYDGVIIGGGATNNTVGGTVSGARNILSGNNANGVGIYDANTESNLVQGNYIGTNATGTADLGNNYDGVGINGGSANNTIGGSAAGAGNLISGNGTTGVGTGVGLYNDVSGNVIQGNRIGTNAAGTAGIPNGDYGVALGFNVDNNLIGGTTAGEGNIIAYNKSWGIRIFTDDSTGNQFLGNSIYSNSRLGISLGYPGLTPILNDEDDADDGANGAQNFPILNTITPTQVTGSLNSAPNTNFRIEFFSSQACDPSGFGEGQTFLGSANVTTNGLGDVPVITFNGAFTTATIITATATNLTSNETSEFSPCLLLTTGAVTKAPMPISPASNGYANDSTTVFTWGAVPNASTYQIEVATTNNFATIIFTATSPARMIKSTAILNDQPYWWHVRALNSSAAPGPFSTPRMFTVDTLAPTEFPTLVSPADNSFTSDLTPAFRWNTMTGAKHYRLVLDTAANCLTAFYESPDITTTSFTLPGIPGFGEGTYYWCVQGDDAAGNWGPLSPGRRFDITLLRIPLNGTSTIDTTPTFTWSRIPGSGIKYQLIINNSADLNTPVYQSALLTVTSFTLPNGNALTPGTYYWTIVMTNGWQVHNQIFWSFTVT